jgi:ribosome-binding protein aMBF1 (putative translation factor)
MEDELVEAIVEGKIMKVRESVAKREGFPIIRKKGIDLKERKEESEEVKLGFDDFRRPLGWKGNKVVGDLVDNFHWEIVRRRRHLDMNRKQLAEKIGEKEEVVKMVENGILPKDDFMIINKLQEVLGINLRKDREDFTQSFRKKVESVNEEKEEEVLGSSEDMVGDDIEIEE